MKSGRGMQKTTIVTGAAGDTGAAIVHALLAKGHRVAGFDVNAGGLRDVHRSASPEAGFLPLVVDIRAMDEVVGAVKQVDERVGPVTHLVNNAGGVTAPTIRTTSEAEWMQDIDLNLNGAWRCIKAVSEGMIANGSGVIINIASVNGQGVYGRPGYSVAKAGLLHLTKFAAVEFGRHGIRTLAITPGTIATKAWKRREAENPGTAEDARRWYPTRKFSTPEDIAKVVSFAADEAPATMNGAIINVDGGLMSGHDVISKSFTGTDF